MLLEREAELSCVGGLVDGVGTSGGRLVLVRGEAGIGKSSLISAIIERHGGDLYTLMGSCDDLLTPQTLAPLWDMARDEPTVAAALATDDARQAQEVVFGLLCRSLRPTLLVIEDTHWADEATLDLIRFLGRRIGRTNALMVLTYRDTEVDREHPLRQVLGDLPPASVIRLSLERLSTGAVGELLTGSTLDRDDVVRQTNGNPLLVRELLTWSSDGEVPSSIQDLVAARVGRAAKETRTLLEYVSVMPGGAETTLLERLSVPVDAGFVEAERAGLLTIGERGISYVHELQRRAVESTLPELRRRELNRAVYDALAPEADAARLVHHAREAVHTDGIVRHGPRAASAAIAAGSPRLALAHLRAVEPHLDLLEPEVAADLLHLQAEIERELGDGAAQQHVDRAVELRRRGDDRAALSSSLILASSVHYDNLETEIALAHAREAVALLEGRPDSVDYARALRVLGYVTWLYYEDIPTSLTIVDRALELARLVGDQSVLIDAMVTKGNIEYSVGIASGIELVEAARALAVSAGDRVRETNALHNMAGMYADFRLLAQASDMARRAIETAIRNEMRGAELVSRAMYAEILMWLGRWDEATDSAAASLDGQSYTESIGWRVLGTVQMRRGAVGARDALDRMWSIAGDAHALTTTDPAAAALAEYMWLTDDLDERWLSALDEVCEFGRAVGNPWPSGALSFWMWKLGRLDEIPGGSADFYMWIPKGEIAAAAEFWGSRGVGYERALALMHGDDDQQLEALRLADDLGAAALGSKIRAGLASAGVSAPRGRSRSTRQHPAGLTARQAEVLDLLVEGLTNVEIADRLFLSPRTVENHVAAILLKLDASTRDAAVVRAVELDLV